MHSISNLHLMIKTTLFALLLFVSSQIRAQEQVIDKIVAKVDNYIVLKSDVETAYLELLVNGRLEGVSEEAAKCRLLEDLIVEKMMLAKAEIDSILVEERQVESQLTRRMAVMKAQFGSLERIEQQYGKTIGDLKNELRERVREQMIIQKMQSEISQSVTKPTPKEVKKFFNGIPKDSIPYFNSEVEVNHIIKIPDINREQKRIVREQLNQIKQRVENGENFGELAKKFSEDYGSAKQGGDLGWLDRGTSVPEFEAAVFRMKPGSLSRIVESEFGFHLIKLIDRRGDQYHAAHILIRPSSADVDVKYAENFLDSLKQIIELDSLSFETAAREYSDDKATSSNGGSITSPTTGSTSIFLDDLDSYLYFTIDTMQVGQISAPVPYRTDDGRNAVRIIYFKSKTEPHTADLEKDYEKIFNFAYNQKRNKTLNDWFLGTREELYLYLDPEYNQCNILGIQ